MIYRGCSGSVTSGVMGDKEPAAQKQGQSPPGGRTRLAGGDEAGWWALQTLGRSWVLLLVPWGAIGRLRAGRHLDLHVKQSLCLEYGPQRVEVEARGPIGDHVGAELRDDGGWPGGGGHDEGSWDHLGNL